MRNCIRLVALCSLVAVVVGVAFFKGGAAPPQPQQPAAPNKSAPAEEQPAEKVYKNIQVFKGVPASQLLGTMSFMAGSLGVGCNHCHTGQFAEDTKPTKQTARRMVEMMRKINADNFESKLEVTCATCHQGHTKPFAKVPLARVDFQSLPAAPPAAAVAAPAAALPSVDDILGRYVQALGGRDKIAKMTTQVMKGSRTEVNGGNPPQTTQVEIYRKAPDKLMMVMASPGGRMTQAYNGTGGWRQFGERVAPITGPDLLGARRDAQFLRNVDLKPQYSAMTVAGLEKVNGREAYVVEGVFTDDSPEKALFGVQHERLYFDAQTGLLIRRYIEYKTPLGQLPEATDYEDYRGVEGVMLPHAIRLTRAPFVNLQKFEEVKVNAAVADEQFEMPAAKK
jgi:hypothetical protein